MGRRLVAGVLSEPPELTEISEGRYLVDAGMLLDVASNPLMEVLPGQHEAIVDMMTSVRSSVCG